jgi:hypothetical protein
VAVHHPTERPASLPEFRERCFAFEDDGEMKGINFSLLVAIELARRMVATADNDSKRGYATILLGNTLLKLGQREAGTARLNEAVAAYREALKAQTRERVPLEWAKTQMNLGNALSALGEREVGTARLNAVGAARLR